MNRTTIGFIDAAFIVIAAIALSVEYGWMTGVAIGLIAHAVRPSN